MHFINWNAFEIGFDAGLRIIERKRHASESLFRSGRVTIDTTFKSNRSPLLFGMHFPAAQAFPTVSAEAGGPFNLPTWSNFLAVPPTLDRILFHANRRVQQVLRTANHLADQSRPVRRRFRQILTAFDEPLEIFLRPLSRRLEYLVSYEGLSVRKVRLCMISLCILLWITESCKSTQVLNEDFIKIVVYFAKLCGNVFAVEDWIPNVIQKLFIEKSGKLLTVLLTSCFYKLRDDAEITKF